MRKILLALALVSQLACTEQAATGNKKQSLPPPLTIGELRDADFAVELSFERALDDGDSFTAYLVSYRHSGLKLYAMVAVPQTERPEDGFPLVIANHGYVPDPTKYGITAAGIDSRPGDYYRSVPELFASRGFMVVIADYRGHNASDGVEYVDGKNSIAYYAEDIVALMAGLSDLDDADLDNVFIWSHSMGGPVSMRAMLATDIVRAASFWSTMPMDDLFADLGNVSLPIMIQHSVEDTSTAFGNSERFAEALAANDIGHEFHSYPGAAHYFDESTREQAADRDAAMFAAAER